MTTALEGVRVLDMTRLLPGAVCTLLLADMGADVIKVEDPIAGDYARWTPPLVDGLGAFFRASNRNKRSVVINLKDSAGQAVFHTLVEHADVVIEGFRPGVTQRLNVDYDTLKTINPRIVYASLSGWGQDGAYADLSGHDLNYVALNGVLGSTRTPHPLGAQIADVGGAYVGVMGVLAALLKRERTGDGAYIDVALSESAMPFAMYQFVESVVAGLPGGGGTLTGLMAFYDVYHSSDGQPMALAPIEPKFWANFCNAVGHPEWIEKQQNMAAQVELKAALTDMFLTKTALEWHHLLAEADCCFSLITPPEDLMDDPHVQSRGMAMTMPDGVPTMRSPVRLDDDQFNVRPAPAYGEHTREVLLSMGYDDDAIATLHDTGVIKAVR